jgi:predicted ATP-grasp superfamily ATP-dependent carboligase
MVSDVKTTTPALDPELEIPTAAGRSDPSEDQHKYTTARAIELVTEALQISAGLSRLTSKAEEMERNLKDVIEAKERESNKEVG